MIRCQNIKFSQRKKVKKEDGQEEGRDKTKRRNRGRKGKGKREKGEEKCHAIGWSSLPLLRLLPSLIFLSFSSSRLFPQKRILLGNALRFFFMNLCMLCYLADVILVFLYQLFCGVNYERSCMSG